MHGPHRVSPGRLSVSRTFGDVEAKLQSFGGLPGVVVATPDVVKIQLKESVDFIFLGCDGIFDVMDNKEIVESVYISTQSQVRAKDLHSQCGVALDLIMKTSLARRSLDNVTGVIITFEKFQKFFDSLNVTKEDKTKQTSEISENAFEKAKSSLLSSAIKQGRNVKSNKHIETRIKRSDSLLNEKSDVNKSSEFLRNSTSSFHKFNSDANLTHLVRGCNKNAVINLQLKKAQENIIQK